MIELSCEDYRIILKHGIDNNGHNITTTEHIKKCPMFSSPGNEEWSSAMTYYYDTFGEVKKEQVKYGIYSACGTMPARYNVRVKMIQRNGWHIWTSHALKPQDADKLVDFFNVTLRKMISKN
jgi:hypothetical protein